MRRTCSNRRKQITVKGSLIIVQNAMADSMNGDLQRMRRVLAHEICHLFVRGKSCSSSFLGDGLKDMKVRPWIDEGFTYCQIRFP